MSWKTSSRPFDKKIKIERISESTTEMLQNLFLLYVQVEVYRNILKLRC